MLLHRWILVASLGLGIPLAGVACVSAVDVSGPAPPRDGLTLTADEPLSVAGSYAEQGVAVSFASRNSNGNTHLTLASANGSALLDIVDDASTGTQTTVFLGGRLKQVMSHSLMKVGSSIVASPGPDDFRSEGDVEAVADLARRPEMKLLPDLSRKLGEMGLDGKSHPAALPIHLTALRAAQDGPAGGAPIPGEPSRHTQGIDPNRPGFVCTPIKCPAGGTACLGGNGCNNGFTDYCPTAGGADLQSNPCNNQCYGMCGPGCDCWTQICGDCRYHSSCAKHDDWCGACSIYQPWYCSLCYSPTAFFAFDCRY